VYEVRKALGRQLARESGVPADIVIAVPDSGVPAAIGYAEEAGLPYEMGLIRNHYVGRTFIEPSNSIRHFGVKVKLNALREVLDGKRVIVVDDSIVRGTTSRKLIHMIRQAGAREVHMRISSPPTTHPCFYGIDTPTREELIASTHSVEEIRQYLSADSLAYLSHAGLFAFNGASAGFCDACFTGRYPVPLAEEMRTRQLHLFEARERS
jgi:amidophosphoribosyltransferase